MTYPSNPSFTELVDWVDGRLEEQRANEVAAHVAHGEAEVIDAVDWIRSFVAAGRLMPLATPPPEVREAVRGAVMQSLLPWMPLSSADATRDLDSRLAPTGTGMRGGDLDQIVHLDFVSPLGPIRLDVVPAGPDEVDIHASVAPTDPDAPRRRLVFTSGRTVRRTVMVGHDGRVKVSNLPMSVDEIWLEQGEQQVRTPVQLRN